MPFPRFDHPPDYESLYTDGWREPGDDTERWGHYALAAIFLLGGIALVLYALLTFRQPETIRPDVAKSVSMSPSRGASYVMISLGAGLSFLSGLFLIRESRRWDFSKMSAERVVAGGFVLGIALIFVGSQIGARFGVGRETHSLTRGIGAYNVAMFFVAAGILDLVGFLFIGLAFAYAPRIQRRIKRVRVLRRYALDDQQNELDDHPSPFQDGLKAVVVLGLPSGKRCLLRASESAYRQAAEAEIGVATVRGERLERFERSERIE